MKETVLNVEKSGKMREPPLSGPHTSRAQPPKESHPSPHPARKKGMPTSNRTRSQPPPVRNVPQAAPSSVAPRKKRPRTKKRRRHGRQTLNYIFYGIIGGAILSILCYTIFFKAYKIVVSGDLGPYTPQQIIEISGIKEGQSLFHISQEKVQVLLSAKLPYVEAVQVKKRFPTVVEMVITPAKPTGVLSGNAGYVYISKTGRILESGLPEYDRQYPLVTGMTPTSVMPGESALGASSTQMQLLIHFFQAAEEVALEGISHISVANRLNLRIIIEDRLLVELGTDNDLAFKLEFVHRTLLNNLDSKAKGVLDVTMLSQINRGFFREEKNIMELLDVGEQAVQDTPVTLGESETQPQAPKESGIKVDPQTGKIIVGPINPMKPNENTATSQPGTTSGSGASGAQGEASKAPADSAAKTPEKAESKASGDSSTAKQSETSIAASSS